MGKSGEWMLSKLPTTVIKAFNCCLYTRTAILYSMFELRYEVNVEEKSTVLVLIVLVLK